MRSKFILTEEEKRSILQLYTKRSIYEQTTPSNTASTLSNTANTVSNTASTLSNTANTVSNTASTLSVSASTTGNVVDPSKSDQKVISLQNKVNEKTSSGLNPDGKWGPKTATAVLNALKSLSPNSTNPS